MKTIRIIAACLLSSTLTQAQLPVSKWAKGFGGSGADVATSTTIDLSGNTYVAGSFEGSIDFSGKGSAVLHSYGGADVFLLKLNNSGGFDWAANVGGGGTDEAYSVENDLSGNVYVSGTFEGTVDFDPGAGTQFRTSNGRSDAFVLKLDANGNFMWVYTFGGNDDEAALSLDLDASGHLLIGGYFSDAVDFDNGAGSDIQISVGLKDGFVLQLSTSGSFSWAKTIGGSGDDMIRALELDAAGNVLLAGSFHNTVDFDPGGGTANIASNGLSDLFVVKLNAAGDYIWSVSKGGLLEDEAFGIALDAGGNIFVTGMFSGVVDFDGGSGTRLLTSLGLSDAFILKLSASGGFSWAHNMGGLLGDRGNSVSVDGSGQVYVAGSFFGTLNIGGLSLPAVGMSDAFLTKFSSSGSIIWSRNVGSSTDDYSNAVTVNSAGDIAYAGSFSGDADFGMGAGSVPVVAPGSNSDVFAQRITQSGTFIDAVNSVSAILPYPNPSSGTVYLGLNIPCEVAIYNANGLLVWQKELQGGQQSIDLSAQPAGLYFLTMVATDKTAVENHRIQKF